MQDRSGLKAVCFVPIMMALFVSGCAPGPPPLEPGLFITVIGWLLAGLLVWIGILLWKRVNSMEAGNTAQIVDALNALNDRLTALEEKVKQWEKLNRQRRVP